MPPDIAFKRLRGSGPALALGLAFGFATGAPALAQSFFTGEAAAPSDERRPVRVIPTTQTPGALAPPAVRPASAAAPAAASASGQGAPAGRLSGAAPVGAFGGHSAFSPVLSVNNSGALAPPPRQSEGSAAVTGAASLLRPSPAPARAFPAPPHQQHPGLPACRRNRAIGMADVPDRASGAASQFVQGELSRRRLGDAGGLLSHAHHQ